MGPHLRRHQLSVTCLGGVAVGILVTLTSVGAGALVAVLLMLIYPLRLSSKKLVGTDIIHAVPLTFVAAVGHSWLGNVDAELLINLLVGSIPGIVAGTLLAGRLSDQFIRYALTGMLTFSGLKLLIA